MFLALLRANFNPRYARAKIILSRAKNDSESGQKHIYARKRQLYCYNIVSSFQLSYIITVGHSDKYAGIVHQRDVWHGGKSIGKKVTSVSFTANNFCTVHCA